MKQISHKLAMGALSAALCWGAGGCGSTGTTPPAADSADVATSDTEANIKPDTGPKTFKMGLVVPVGTIGYKIESIAYKDKLDDGTKPAAGRRFLLVKTLTRNTGPKEGAFATFRLMDGTTEYALSEKGAKSAESLNEVKSLAKDEGKNGYLIFETPTLRVPQLKISAAPPLKDVMFIALTENAPAVARTPLSGAKTPAAK